MRSKIKRVFKKSKRSVQAASSTKFAQYSTLQLLKMTSTLAQETVKSFWVRHRVASRVVAWTLLFIILFGIFNELYGSRNVVDAYDISGRRGALLSNPVDLYADKLVIDSKTGSIVYNEGYTPGGEVAGLISGPKFSANFGNASDGLVQITDPQNQVSFSVKPKYRVREPKKTDNRVIYPIVTKKASVVYTARAASVKEDIILFEEQGDEISFSYELELGDSMEARLEANGSVGVYGVEGVLLGNVSTSTEKDAQLLEKARKSAEKTKLIFSIPPPHVTETGITASKIKPWFELDGNLLTIKTKDLKSASYPLSIDPTIYVETAAKLMRGNNETNTDFDVDDELIQKSQTTGARIDTWQGNLDISEGVWGQNTAVAGGYIYRSGGRTGAAAKPQVVDQQQTLLNSGSTFTMDMPATRPADDLYIAILCHDGSDGGAMTYDNSWTQVYDTQGYGMYWKIGQNISGGNEASTYGWGGYGSEEWAGVIMRITDFYTSDPISGTPGTGSNSGTATPVFPATTPDSDTTLIIRGAGWDQDNPSSTGWVPTGHTKIDSSSSSGGGNGSCGFAAASIDNPPAASVSTGTATFADASVSDDYGASTIAINPIPATPTTQTTVDWAAFNSSTLAIESPNPGDGACSGWCNESVYDLPSARRGHSMIAYNGYLYVMGGVDGSGSRASTVYVAKLGANGEPSLWHPTDTDPDNWVYWFSDSGLNGGTAKSYFSAVAYNNRMYVVGGETNASPGGITTVEQADILPNGKLGTWTTTGMQVLPAGAGTHMGGAHIYNGVMYALGGFEGAVTSSANLRSAVYYSKLNSDGTMNAWQSTDSFTTARANFGGTFSYVWGAYIYMGGGCSAVNGSGYCTTISSDMQLASINADGSLDVWRDLGVLDNTRIGYSLIGWQGGLYRLGGCTTQHASSGECTTTLADVDYGVINPAGEVSTVNITVASGVAPCSGGSPESCDLPTVGDDAGESGHMLNMTVIMNGFLYVIGGCAEYNCNDGGNSPTSDNISSNTAHVAIDPDGTMVAPSSCGGTSYGAWCVDSTNTINGTDGVAAAGVTVFNNRIYVVGGIDSTGGTTGELYYTGVNATTGAITGWTAQTLSSVGISENIFYTYINARANPTQAGTYDGNLYVFGGCGNSGGGAGCASSDYETEVYKCWIEDTGEIENTAGSTTYDCTTSGQQQIDSTPGTGGTDGLGIHSGTVYANYIYLVGGFSQAESDKDDVIYARFDNNNNVVAVSGSDWIESPNKLSVGRRRGWAFGYNGHIYAVGGYDAGGGGIIPFIEWTKINVSDGSLDTFVTSSVTINQRWGLSMAVSNSYAYVIGGCDVGASPSSCSSFEPSIQTFQLYNNDSGSIDNFTAQSDQTFTADTDRWGASSVIYNGYLYVAGGCISATDCTNATNSVQYAPISPANGSVGTWAAGGNLPADRAWGTLEEAGGTLYYIGGQNDTATNEQSTVYYTTGISSGNPTWSGTAASNGLPGARTKFGSTVWNDRLYVVGGLDGSAAVSSTVYVSPQLSSGGDISSAWSSLTAFNVARTGAAVTSYANNLYVIGGFDGTNYLSDTQYTQINSDGTVDSWTYTRNLAGPLRDSKAVSANGYIYLVGGRSAASTCNPKILVTPISANTTIASGNNPTGVGEWFETNVRYTGDRYGVAAEYINGKIYTMGGGCTSPLSSNRLYESTVNSQPQVAIYSRMIDTDTDVFPNSWLMNGLDNSIGARWQVNYRSMHDLDGVVDPTEDCGTSSSMSVMTTWGQDTAYGDVTLGDIAPYVAKNSSGGDINCARYFYFFVYIDASKTFGYPEDVNRGPTISDLSLFFTSDPSKRLRHGKTFTGGEQQPLDTPCRQSVDANCPLP